MVELEFIFDKNVAEISSMRRVPPSSKFVHGGMMLPRFLPNFVSIEILEILLRTLNKLKF